MLRIRRSPHLSLLLAIAIVVAQWLIVSHDHEFSSHTHEQCDVCTLSKHIKHGLLETSSLIFLQTALVVEPITESGSLTSRPLPHAASRSPPVTA